MDLNAESIQQTLSRRQRPASAPPALASTFVDEWERRGNRLVQARTIFLTGRECPLACTMCDLWQYTLPREVHSTPIGSIPLQIEACRTDSAETPWIKLYNASNFFDPLAVPVEDYQRIASLCSGFEKVIVENHPRFDNRHIRTFQSMLPAQLEIAIGLESTNDAVLRLLSKQMTRSVAERTIKSWIQLGIDVRAFLLVKPPLPDQSLSWIEQTYLSVKDAFDWGISQVSLIPTRAKWGLLKEWVDQGRYQTPTVCDLELALVRCAELESDRHTILVDLWDLDEVSGQCECCSKARRDRFVAWNEKATSIDVQPFICPSCSWMQSS